MKSWASCNLDEEILDILETDSPITVRLLCSLLFPSCSWLDAQADIAVAVRAHCATLVRRQLLIEIRPDVFAPACRGNA
jgi:hypothetical protein